MNNENLLVEERARDIGNFLVGRLLPFRRKRQVGPFTFIDHMGPATIGPGKYMDVDQHPHIGLSTLTYLLEGAIEHRDSTGTVQTIGPRDVGFMTSGRGVTHTERTPQTLRNGDSFKVHGYQIWVALPKEMEDAAPNFQFVPADQLPTWKQNGLELRLVAGEGFGRKAPLKVYSPLFMVEVYAENPAPLKIAGELEGEIAIVVTEGGAEVENEEIGAGQMLISQTENTCELQLKAQTRVLLFGGQPFPEPRYLLWNFVSSSKETLQKAKEDWISRNFPKVPADETYIPFPGK